jgi:hypothetical protein
MLYAIWRGQDNEKLYWSRLESLEKTWSKPKEIPEARTDTRPSIAALGDTLIVLWKNSKDENLCYSKSTHSSEENLAWSGPHKTNFGSKAGPAIACWKSHNGSESSLWAAWRGVAGDGLFWRAKFDGKGWEDQSPDFIDVSTDTRPALASGLGRLYLAWTSSAHDTDEQIRISILEAESENWERPFSIQPHCHSSAAPSLARVKDAVLVAWRGKGNDTGIWITSCDVAGDPIHFERPQRLDKVSTGSTPAMIEFKDHLVFVWKGGWNNDCRLWWGYGRVGEGSL